MIPYKTFFEQMVTGGFAVARIQMPQIKDVDGFKEFLGANNIEHNLIEADPLTIKPTQVDIDVDKVNAITDFDSPIIVSADNFVLDGHHRYFASKSRAYIKVLKVEADINVLLKLAFEFIDRE